MMTSALSAGNNIAICEYGVTGTSFPPTSGSPTTISNQTGTVISGNFFNSGAIDPPYRDNQEYVSVCISPFDSQGNRSAEITTDVGRDNDFIVKAYPQFVVGTKFGNQFETSFRYYSNNGLAPEDRWPVVATGQDINGQPYQFANLEYVSRKKKVKLPAFTNDLPEIVVHIDLDEHNVVGSERDVMLESWFFDTSANASQIGNNTATNQPIANTLNNIVGVGHPLSPEFNNTLLEMMVHIGPLSKNDISEANNNPGQKQLTEIYSGKDSDGDGIDDHFDVDSHAYVDSTNPNDPDPGLYSSGNDLNNDGIDDADLLPIKIGDYEYSIWYGTTFFAPLVIFSRETDLSLTIDFNPATADMDLTREGLIELPWNEFIDYTLTSLESPLQAAGVSWATGASNPFPKMNASSGAIGGIEFGVEPQINAPSDQAYSAVINTLVINVDGRDFGLKDSTAPISTMEFPTDGLSIDSGITGFIANVSDSETGVRRVRLRIRRLGVTPAEFWNGNSWTTSPESVDALETGDGSTWTLPNIDLSVPGDYRAWLITNDNAGNVALAADNPITTFTVVLNDRTPPSANATTPADNETITNAAAVSISGIATDSESGISAVNVRIQRLGTLPTLFWNGIDWTSESVYLPANLSSDGTTWSLDAVDLSVPARYRVRVTARDVAGNLARAVDNAKTEFTVQFNDQTIPFAQATSPANGQSVLASDNRRIAGTASDTGTGVAEVNVRIQRLNTVPALFWNGTEWTTETGYISTDLEDSGMWTLENVDLSVPGNYRVRVNAKDVANNFALAVDNPKTEFIVTQLNN